MKDSELRKRAKAFALRIIMVCDTIDTRKGRSVLVNQITRSATSIGANIHEANYGASKADFTNKLQIALKECYETDYWLNIFKDSQILSEDKYYYLYNKCCKLRRILIASINTAKKHVN